MNYTWNRTEFKQKTLEKICLKVISDIELLKKQVDKVVLLPHWGYEFVTIPPYGVTQEAKLFIDAGADLIVGSHPHVLQGYEQYCGKYIFYSLGNFIFDMRYANTKYSAILNYSIKMDGKDDFNPIYCKSNNHFIPVPIGHNEIVKKIGPKIFHNLSNSINYIDNSYELLYAKFEQQYGKLKRYTILHHFTEMLRNPTIILLIMKKIAVFIKILLGYLQGKKVRW